MKRRRSKYRLKYYNFWFLGKKYIGCNLSLGQFSLGAVFLGTICPRGNYVDNKSSERQFSSGTISRGILSGSNCLSSNCLGAIIRGQSSKGQLSGGNIPREQLSSVEIFQGAIVRGVIFLGDNCPDTVENVLNTGSEA